MGVYVRAAVVVAGLCIVATTVPAQGLEFPPGLTLANQLEYAWSRDSNEPTLENWTNVDYTRGALSAGARFVGFQPPDPTVSASPSHFDLNYRYVEATTDAGSFRVGHFYSLLGAGLALNAYEDRDVRIDSNLEGVRLSADQGDVSLKLLSGTTVFGSSEDLERPRGNRIHAADVEFLPSTLGVSVGASAVRLQRDGSAAQNLGSVRASVTREFIYLQGEYGTIDRPGPTGRGLYLLSTVGLGPLDVLFEYKDYRSFWLKNSGGIPYNLPPSVIRDHTYTLLNRHPHVLDADDEKGMQVEGSLRIADHTLLGNFARTRNQNDDDVFNYFDEIYGELEVWLGAVGPIDDVTVINAYDYQKSFASGLTPDRFRKLHTNVHEVRLIADDVNSFRVQVERQHNESQLEGEFDSWFGLLEWSRSPDVTFNVVGETSNRSDVQLASGESADALYGIVSVHVSENHDLSVLYGSRLAGFVCVGGVCRLEPEFDGIEVRLLSRF